MEPANLFNILIPFGSYVPSAEKQSAVALLHFCQDCLKKLYNFELTFTVLREVIVISDLKSTW